MVLWGLITLPGNNFFFLAPLFCSIILYGIYQSPLLTTPLNLHICKSSTLLASGGQTSFYIYNYFNTKQINTLNFSCGGIKIVSMSFSSLNLSTISRDTHDHLECFSLSKMGAVVTDRPSLVDLRRSTNLITMN